jgi:26S proteasome regulatory subunit N1
MPAAGDERGEAMEVVDDKGQAAEEERKKKAGGGKGKGKDGAPGPDELSEEDKALQEGLELAVVRLQEPDATLHKQALDHLVNEIRTATSSMTSVPKPLKFLRPHYDALKKVYQNWSVSHAMKRTMADVMSVLAMTMAERGTRECLKFKLQGTNTDISSWGHEYVRYLSGEISEEYNKRNLEETDMAEDVDVDDLLALVDDIVPFQMQHNAEAEAADLLMEVQQLKKLINSPIVDERNYERVCLYLLRSADFLVDPDDLYSIFSTVFSIYLHQNKFTDALRVALKMGDSERIAELFTALDAVAAAGESEGKGKRGLTAAQAVTMKTQLAFVLARHRSGFVLEGNDELNAIIGNAKLSERFLSVARSMDVLEAKAPEDIFKTGDASRRSSSSTFGGASVVESARANLASSFVNGFVNAGFCSDKLMLGGEAGSSWVRRNKDHAMLSATASLGSIMMWNLDDGLMKIDPYLNDEEDFVRAGAFLALGIICSGVKDESDPGIALLQEPVLESPKEIVRVAATTGLGIAYAGMSKEEVQEIMVPILGNSDSSIVEASLAALALGMVYVGSCNDDVGTYIVQRLMEASPEDLDNSISRFLCLGLGLLYVGKTEKADAMLEIVRTVGHKRGKYCEITLETCAYATSGNVLKVQQLLQVCAERLTENAEHQAAAVLGLGLVSMGEDVATEMTMRTFEHLLHYAELPVRRVVPLAIALLYVSNPDYLIVEQLSRLSHDVDPELAQSAILGLGLVSAGSNNSRVAQLLRQCAEFYAKEANHLFCVRIAQGLNAAAKGLVTLSPFHSDR